MGKAVEQQQTWKKLPEEWQLVQLGDLCVIQNGYAFKSSDFINQGIPVIKMGNISKDFYLKWESEKLSYLPKDYIDLYSEYVVSRNNLLITLTDMSPSGEYLGTVALYDQDTPALLNQRVGRFSSINIELDIQYLYFRLRTIEFKKYALHDDTGNLQKNTNPEYLYRFKFRLPPLPEQKRIVEILNDRLSAVEKARAATEAQLAAAKALPAAYLRQVFDSPEAQKWPRKKLGDIAKTCSGSTPSRSQKDYYIGEIPWVKTGELKDGFIYDTEEHINEIALRETSVKLLPVNTLLVAMYGQGQTRGRTGLLTKPATTNQACFAILPNDNEFDPKYLQIWFRHSYLRIREETEGRGGNQPNLNGELLREQIVYLPSLEKQNEIVSNLKLSERQVEQLQESLQSQLDTINQIPAALLRQAFNGEL